MSKPNLKSPLKLSTEYKRKLLKAIHHLDYSYQKIMKLSDQVSQMNEEVLETWESFSARFSRVADLFLTKFVRAMVLEQDAGFEGSLRDFVNQGEKIGILDRAEVWMEIRALRNISAHDYTEEELTEFFGRLKQEAPRLLELKAKLQ